MCDDVYAEEGFGPAELDALRSAWESPAYEVRLHGVHVSLIELDGMRTGNAFAHVERREPDYAAPRARMLQRLEHVTGAGGEDPSALARCVFDVLRSDAPQLRYALGSKLAALSKTARGSGTR